MHNQHCEKMTQVRGLTETRQVEQGRAHRSCFYRKRSREAPFAALNLSSTWQHEQVPRNDECVPRLRDDDTGSQSD